VGKFVHDDRGDLYYRLCGQAFGGRLRHSLDQLLGLGGGLGFGGEGELNQAESDRLVVGVAQFVEVEALDLGAIEEGLVDGGVEGFEAAAGKDQDAVPVDRSGDQGRSRRLGRGSVGRVRENTSPLLPPLRTGLDSSPIIRLKPPTVRTFTRVKLLMTSLMEVNQIFLSV
jgi:hypothetical protein